MNAAVIKVRQLSYFHIAQMGLAAGELRVVIEQVPLVVVFYDGVVVGPAEYRGEHYAFVGVGAVEIVGYRVGDKVGVARGVGQIIFAVEFMYPGTFKKAAIGVGAEQGDASAIEDLNILGRLCELQHVVTQLGDFRAVSRLIAGRVFIFCDVTAARPALQLSAPDAAEHHVVSTVVIFKYSWVDTKAAFDRFGFGFKWTGR